MRNPKPLHGHFHFAVKKGYSGVGLYRTRQPDQIIEGFGIHDIDAEALPEARFGRLSLVSLYVPARSSSSSGWRSLNFRVDHSP
jgi:exodeoxyribonuclease-3